MRKTITKELQDARDAIKVVIERKKAHDLTWVALIEAITELEQTIADLSRNE